jgi:two-component system chemotaxis response regulator CheY
MQVTSMNGDADNAPLMLPEILDLAAAEGFLELMRQRVNDEGPLRIDASAVKTLTLPCSQIILAATRSREAISIKNPSFAFVDALGDLGIEWLQYLDSSPKQEQDQGQEQEQSQDQVQGQNADQVQPQSADEAAMQAEPSQPAEPSQIELPPINESSMGKRILTIDDSKTMRDMLMLTLAEAGFDVLQAVDGQDGLDVLVNEQVDVVITDINMPRMDGYEVIRQLRRNPNHKTTPILVLTTESETEKKNLAREAGATGWMVKPFDPDRLIATVRKVAP